MFLTVAEFRELSTFNEVKALSDVQLQRYIDRADSWIIRETRRSDLSTTDSVYIQTDLKTATILLVEYIWYLDQPSVKESHMGGLESERVGTYSYNKGQKDGLTGNEELDSILMRYRYIPGVNLFSVSTPSKVSAKPFNPHAWVTDYED